MVLMRYVLLMRYCAIVSIELPFIRITILLESVFYYLEFGGYCEGGVVRSLVRDGGE